MKIFTAIINFFKSLFGKKKPKAPSVPVTANFYGRTFPSTFQAWNGVDPIPEGETAESMAARHDLLWNVPEFFGLRWQGTSSSTTPAPFPFFEPESIGAAQAMRARLLALNPAMKLLCQIGYYETSDATTQLSPDSNWWLRDGYGNRIPNWLEGQSYKININLPEVQQRCIDSAKAAMDSGVFDGIMLDVWFDDIPQQNIIKGIRAAIGDALIICNCNDRILPNTVGYMNGVFMECGPTNLRPDQWARMKKAIEYNEANVRSPRANCLEANYSHSREDLSQMRALTCLSLTHSDGYVLFADPNDLPTGDHSHQWYPFWNKSLGVPAGQVQVRPDGAFQREFEHGTVVYNPMGNSSIKIAFPQSRKSAADGTSSSSSHSLAPCDGGIYLY